MSFNALEDWVLIAPDKHQADNGARLGTVQSVGQGRRSETTGDVIPIESPAAGDRVMYADHLAAGVYDAVQVEDIVAVQAASAQDAASGDAAAAEPETVEAVLQAALGYVDQAGACANDSACGRADIVNHLVDAKDGIQKAQAMLSS